MLQTQLAALHTHLPRERGEMRPGEIRKATAEAAQGLANHQGLLWVSSTVPMKIHARIQGLIAIVTEPRNFAPHTPGDWLVICCFSITDQQPSHIKSNDLPGTMKGIYAGQGTELDVSSLIFAFLQLKQVKMARKKC